MTIELPEGYTLGQGRWDTRESARTMLGSDWQVAVYHKGYPAFKLAKQYRMDTYRVEYAGKLSGTDGAWHRSYDLRELVLIMCAKHRIGVGR